MSHTPHELAEEFPDQADKIHDLKTNNGHFAKLFDAYHEVNREIHRAEASNNNVSDEHMSNMHKERMRLKDEIARMLTS